MSPNAGTNRAARLAAATVTVAPAALKRTAGVVPASASATSSDRRCRIRCTSSTSARPSSCASRPARRALAHAGLWLDLRSLRPRLDRRGRPTKQQALLRLPLRSYAYHKARAAAGATTALTVQLIKRPAARPERATPRLPDGRPTAARASW